MTTRRIALAATLAAALFGAGGPGQAQVGDLVWTSKVTGSGSGLILSRRGAQVFSLACVRGTREVLAIVEGLKPVAGQDRLALNFDDLLVPFVIKAQAMKEGRVVEAAAKTRPELLDAIRQARQIRGAYGNAKIGPFPAPPRALSQGFAAQCGPLI